MYRENDLELTNGTLLTQIISSPVNGNISLISDTSVLYTPNQNFVGSDKFTYAICNQERLCDTANVFLTVNTLGYKPIAQNDTVELLQGETISFNPILNDITPGDSELSFSILTQLFNGELAVERIDSVIYTANNDFSGIDIISYTICNSLNICDTASIKFIVQPKTPPTAFSDIYATISGAIISISVLDNDIDAENNIDNSSVNALTSPENGTLTELGFGNFEYQSSPFFIGKDQFVYNICDSTGLCDSDTVFILVESPESDLVKISKGFSPNGDGINDNWSIEGLEFFPRNQIKVFSRDGNIVYETIGYNNSTEFWDGKSMHPLDFGNGFVPEGTYFYVLDLGNGEKPQSGYIEIKY